MSVGQRGDDREVDGAGQRQPGEHAVEVDRGGPPRAHAGDEAAVLLQVVRLVHRVELHRGVEVREQDDEQRLEDDVVLGARGQEVGDRTGRTSPGPPSSASVGGRITTDEAKMTGITPAMFTRSGM